jgi:hypothetical protein
LSTLAKPISATRRSWHGLLNRPIAKFASLDRDVRLALLLLVVLSAAIQAIYLWALPVSYEGDASVYYRFAKWIGLIERHPHVFWARPPGYPLYLHIFGMTWLDSFNGVIAVNALLGVLSPAFLYGALYPLGRRWAFAAALILAVSTVPFSYAKVFITEHPYSFLLIFLAFAASRFFVTEKRAYVYLAMGAAFAALMTRNEAVFIAIAVAVLQLAFALHRRNRTAIVAVCISSVVTLTATMTWSGLRAIGLKQPELFGSLSNYGGWQTFHRVYTSPLGSEARSYKFSRPPEDAADRWSTDRQRVIFVQAKNGPASAELATMMPGLLEDPSEVHFGEIVTELLRRGDDGANTVGYHKGILYTDNFLRRVVRETVIAHPEVVPLIVLNATDYLGLSLPVANAWPPPYFSLWSQDAYEALPFDIGQQASTSMRPRLFKKYADSQWPRPEWLNSLHRAGQLSHNILRNTLGVVLSLTIWFLPLTRYRWLAAFVVATMALQAGAGAAGFGFNGRYEHMVIPYLLMTAVLSLEALWSWARALRRRTVAT